MAINPVYSRQPLPRGRPDIALPAFAAPTTSIPVPDRSAPVGGGTPQASPALDPTGLVPVNRTQPLATDAMEPQRLMERRLGSMPPSSFSGAGNGFVPLDRGVSTSPVFNYAERQTMAGPNIAPVGDVHTMDLGSATAVARSHGLRGAEMAAAGDDRNNARGGGFDVTALPAGITIPQGFDVTALPRGLHHAISNIFQRQGPEAAQALLDRFVAVASSPRPPARGLLGMGG